MKYLLVFAIVTFSAYSNDQLDIFLEANGHLIQNIDKDRVYLKKENISIEDTGFRVYDSSGKGFQTKDLFTDVEGIYTKLFSLSDEKVWNIVYCQNCEAWRSIDIRGNCTYCGKNPANPD